MYSVFISVLMHKFEIESGKWTLMKWKVTERSNTGTGTGSNYLNS